MSYIVEESKGSELPTIIRPPKTLNTDVVNILNKRIGDEYTAHYFYRSASNWCANKSYKKAANFFADEADNELIHAKGLQKYLTDWDCIPTIPSVITHVQFNNLPEIVVGAYDMEYDLFQQYVNDSKALFNVDLATFDFLQEYRKIQTESVAEYADLLNALQLINLENNFDILYFEQTYF